MSGEARLAARALELVRAYGRIRLLTDQRYEAAREQGPIEEPLGFYREEDEFIEAGENLPVHREPVDSTFPENFYAGTDLDPELFEPIWQMNRGGVSILAEKLPHRYLVKRCQARCIC